MLVEFDTDKGFFDESDSVRDNSLIVGATSFKGVCELDKLEIGVAEAFDNMSSPKKEQANASPVDIDV